MNLVKPCWNNPPTSEHTENPEPTLNLEAITLLNLFLKRIPEQKQLIFQFPINLGKRSSRCQKLFIKRQLCGLLSFSSPQYHRTSNCLTTPEAECSSGLADKTVRHNRSKERKFSLLSQCAAVLRLKKKKACVCVCVCNMESPGELERETTLQVKTHLYQKLNLNNEHHLYCSG